MSDILLEVRDLKKHFKVPEGYLHAVDGISFRIEKGKTLGVVGESGCGKSTLGRTVLRLHEPASGEILFEEKNITQYNKHEMKKIRKDMQIIFQDPYSSLNPRMCIQELIAEPIIINRICSSKSDVFKKVCYLMNLVGLDRRFLGTYPHELDGGRRQRIGIARALALNPKFIVCDEPVSALDVSIQAQILNLLMDIQDELKLTYMFITHDLSVVRHISTDIAVMYLGKCVELCPSKELFKNPVHPYTKALLSAIPVPKSEMRHKKTEIIKGELTSPVNPKPGCRFSARCPHAGDNCTRDDTILKEVSSGHFVSCTNCKQ
ncbi:oligopeptide/dipeptide ABC transporter ATP-binding protein [Sedimentibacter sp.]|uniref:ABC transporter ATP-binding protein n=1 Tax=Sedimentibacter sp. TaxID=1960295 RepID=UPI0028A8822F|nr:oligopeptide/dipeptide ABC transporter ATP-binding protein [Sedimentibacter sp.]